jgi:FkbM family methyltransferase
VLQNGAYESEINELLKRSVLNGTTVFDVGANIGLSAIPLLTACERSQILSYEASPAVLPYLRRTHNYSRYRNRWEIVPKAVTKESGDAISFTIHAQGGDVFDGIRYTGRGERISSVQVPTTCIDDEWSQRGTPPVSLIKVDVEGGELDVLRGARKCITNCRPVIVSEWSPKNFGVYNVDACSMLELAKEIEYSVFIIPTLTPAGAGRLFEYQIALHENLLLFPLEDAWRSTKGVCDAARDRA